VALSGTTVKRCTWWSRTAKRRFVVAWPTILGRTSSCSRSARSSRGRSGWTFATSFDPLKPCQAISLVFGDPVKERRRWGQYVGMEKRVMTLAAVVAIVVGAGGLFALPVWATSRPTTPVVMPVTGVVSVTGFGVTSLVRGSSDPTTVVARVDRNLEHREREPDLHGGLRAAVRQGHPRR